MIPQQRFVLNQNIAQTEIINFQENGENDEFPPTATVTLYARLPGSPENTFSVVCAFDSATLTIPFSAENLATAGSFDYNIIEQVSGQPAALKLQGFVRNNTGIEIVPTLL